jgi:hypothetical protein
VGIVESHDATTHPNHNIVAVSCGANISAATLRDILAEGDPWEEVTCASR